MATSMAAAAGAAGLCLRVAVCVAAAAAIAAASPRQLACGLDFEDVGGLCTELRAESGTPDAAALGLLQRASELSPKERRTMQMPNFGDILNQAKKAAKGAVDEATDVFSNAVDQAKDVVGNAVDVATEAAQVIQQNITAQAQAIVEQVEEEAVEVASGATTQAGLLAAQSLNNTLLLIGVQASALKKKCIKLRDSVLERMIAAEPTVEARFTELEEATEAAIGDILPVWGNISTAVKSSGAIASSALDAVGATALGKRFATALEKSTSDADACAESLRGVPRALSGFKASSYRKLMETIRQANKTMEDALLSVETYASILMDAFDGLTDKVTEKISGSFPGVNQTAIAQAFDEVDVTAEDILGRIVEGPRDLLSGLRDAAALAESTLPAQEGGAIPRPRSSAAALLALVAASAAFAPAWA